MPELDWTFGQPLAIVLCWGQPFSYLYFKWKKWL
jgi:hypothetical protein